jgi:Zn-finger nucleic acid-binding protein
MNCQNCGAPLKLSEDRRFYTCEYCTAIFFPEESQDGVRVIGDPSRLGCPICTTPLVLAWVQETRVLHCPNCQGLLLPQLAFLATVQYLRARAAGPPIIPPPMNPRNLERQIHCPQCEKRMHTHPYGGPGNIVVDNCPDCLLIWLDRDELGRIRNAPGRDRGRQE